MAYQMNKQIKTGKDAKYWALLIAWLLALGATLVTLYASEIHGLPVCHLCWYQRICIYPLAITLGIASFRADTAMTIYAIPMTILNTLFALYQYLLQMIPSFSPISFCTIGENCSTIHLHWLGFITYPFLSMCASTVMTILLIYAFLDHTHFSSNIGA